RPRRHEIGRPLKPEAADAKRGEDHGRERRAGAVDTTTRTVQHLRHGRANMKAFWLTTGPGSTKVELRETATPEPKPGEILVRVKAASLNRGELLGGKAGAPAKAGGGECSGEVVKLGDGVGGVAIGQRMMGRCGGGFAEYAVMDAREAMRVPGPLSWEEAAATPLTFLVVYDMLVAQGGLAAGHWLLVTAVSSGVGVAALQTGKTLGARVIGTSGSAEKLGRLEKHGLDVGIQTRAPD